MAKERTIQDYAKSGTLRQLRVKPHDLAFEAWGKDYFVQELVRGDYDGDGVEDALIFVIWHYREGSGRGYELYLVSKLMAGRACAVRSFQF